MVAGRSPVPFTCQKLVSLEATDADQVIAATAFGQSRTIVQAVLERCQVTPERTNQSLYRLKESCANSGSSLGGVRSYYWGKGAILILMGETSWYQNNSYWWPLLRFVKLPYLKNITDIATLMNVLQSPYKFQSTHSLRFEKDIFWLSGPTKNGRPRACGKINYISTLGPSPRRYWYLVRWMHIYVFIITLLFCYDLHLEGWV